MIRRVLAVLAVLVLVLAVALLVLVSEPVVKPGLPDEDEETEEPLRIIPLDPEDASRDDLPRSDAQRWLRWLRLHPLLGERPVHVVVRPPYLVFVEGEDAELASRVGRRCAEILGGRYDEFHRLFGERFDLPHLWGRERGDERQLKVYVFESPESFQKYQQDIRQRLHPAVVSYYQPTDQWVYARRGSESFEGRLCHEAAHQLVHVYSKILLQRKDGEEVLWADRRLTGRQHWFQEGFAEFLRAGREPVRARLQEWKSNRNRKQSEWPLVEMLVLRNSEEARRKAAAMAGITGGVRLSSLFWAQSWAFCHFLWHHEDGKYRERLVEYLGIELTGRSGLDEFTKVFWGDGEPDWKGLEAEWHGHVEELWEKLEIK